MELVWKEPTIEEFQGDIKRSLEKQLEEREKDIIWNKYHKQFMKMPFDELKEIVDSYSIRERVEAYLGKHTHIRYKVAKMYLSGQQQKRRRFQNIHLLKQRI